MYSINMPPATLVEDSLNDRHQPSVANIHKLPLILGKEEGPQMDPVCGSMRQLITTSTVKNDIIAT
jgi:hypothetical protein